MADPLKPKPSMFDDGTTLPPEIQAKLERLAELEKTNADLLKDKEAMKARLDTRNLHPDASGVIELEETDAKGRPMFRYHIDLPPSGGLSITVDGIPYFHGQSYPINQDQLASMMDMVHQSWRHEENIHGSNENSYRPQLNQKFSMRYGRIGR